MNSFNNCIDLPAFYAFIIIILIVQELIYIDVFWIHILILMHIYIYIYIYTYYLINLRFVTDSTIRQQL